MSAFHQGVDGNSSSVILSEAKDLLLTSFNSRSFRFAQDDKCEVPRITKVTVMDYELSTAKQVLERTPATLESLLVGLSDEWLDATEGGDSWSPRQVVAHMLGAERSAWIPRLRLILDASEPQRFQPFDRTAEIHASRGRPFEELVMEFRERRRESLSLLSTLPIDEATLSKTGIHPEFGLVELRQLLATWTVHDLAHLVQIERTMAKQYSAAVGPWIANFRVIR